MAGLPRARGSAPPVSVLQAKLPCAHGVDNKSALGACEAAGSDCGLVVASRTRRTMVLMPLVRPALLTRLASPSCCTGGGAASGAAGQGLIAELVHDEIREGLSISVETPCIQQGEAFISALSIRLESIHRGSSRGDLSFRDCGVATATSAAVARQRGQANYLVAKILSDCSFEPGTAMADLVQRIAAVCVVDMDLLSDDRFVTNYRSPSTSTLGRGVTPNPTPVGACEAGVNQLCTLLRKHLAAIDIQRPPIVEPWLQSSVERCVYARVGAMVWRFYESRLAKDDASYLRNAEVLRSLTDAQLLDDLEVNPAFRGCGLVPLNTMSRYRGRFCDEVDSRGTPSTSAETDETVSLRETNSCQYFDVIPLLPPRPYERAAAALSQLENALSSGCGRTPDELVKALMNAQFEMRTGALEASNGQVELSSMDDVMPLFIFVLLRSTLRRPLACAQLLNDSLSPDQRLQEEGRAVLLLESAARYVAFDWDVAALTPQATKDQTCL